MLECVCGGGGGGGGSRDKCGWYVYCAVCFLCREFVMAGHVGVHHKERR